MKTKSVLIIVVEFLIVLKGLENSLDEMEIKGCSKACRPHHPDHIIVRIP